MRSMLKPKAKTESGSCPLNRLQKLGFVAVLFFTIKGLLWLLVPVLIATAF